MSKNSNQWLYRVIALARIALGFVFVWAFLDKLIGLGYTTCLDAKTDVVTRFCKTAWLQGGSPTAGFLKNATKGPFADMFQGLASVAVVDWLFMLGLALIGLSLILGIGVRIATITGSILMFMMWLSVIPPANNPLIDEHIIYILLLMIINFSNPQQTWGGGRWWSKQKLVKKLPILQ